MRRGARSWSRGAGIFASLLLCAALACEDLIPVGPDLGPAADLAAPEAVVGVPCGSARCYNAAEQYCHTTDWGASGSCEMRVSPSSGYFACDGPEDCASRACCLLGGASVCGALGFCVAGQTVGEFMCHADPDCGVASRCCPKSASGPFRACVDGLAADQGCPTP